MCQHRHWDQRLEKKEENVPGQVQTSSKPVLTLNFTFCTYRLEHGGLVWYVVMTYSISIMVWDSEI